MKSLSGYFSSMYFWAIVLLLLCAAASSFAIKAVPTTLIIAVAACSLLDIAIKGFVLKKGFRFSASAAISGIIIGSIAPSTLSATAIAAVLAASVVAIASKYIIKIKGRHIFNPATLGLLVSLSLFKLGDEWWAASGFNFARFAIPVTFLLIIANYKAGKLKVSIPFLTVISVLYATTQFINVPFTAYGIFTFFSSLPFYFAFIMLSEPKTSPNAPREQIVFGVALAVIVFALDTQHVRFPLFIALLAGNLAFALYRSGVFKQKQQAAVIQPTN